MSRVLISSIIVYIVTLVLVSIYLVVAMLRLIGGQKWVSTTRLSLRPSALHLPLLFVLHIFGQDVYILNWLAQQRPLARQHSAAEDCEPNYVRAALKAPLCLACLFVRSRPS
ncbi:hypothetical protein VOLCADRAFT_91960 [Volvox carteri f. nagariensis]|uniref:Uncharacterized protein n=1 Tax=Volvox carteri f. nagariensis TaxID=3068 RepID=D8TYE5_VOLCA|nr:uncharacterized protein VOLCADRAFT_91960 [Volvox carteri f. nagariensis]EFJ47626.1 hypothetical protein VOLCADRAFT_91960 [Volvox carteri f. nagariensis]|eukprot:XP_002951450.1 hypothetical protein VOLCADRAFT_91960 [Volvox carteri f. nagariensis]